MKRILFFVLISVVSADAVPGDLNSDGTVDFDDFFIFADHFGDTGTPGNDCASTVLDTVTVVNPIVQDYETWEEVFEVIDMVDPFNGLKWILHGEITTRLGPGLALKEHRLAHVYYFENGKYRIKHFLKPSGHLYSESEKSYTVIEIRQLDDGPMEVIAEMDFTAHGVRYLYDADMNVVGEEDNSSGGGTTYGRRHYYFYPLGPGSWQIKQGVKETDPPSWWGEFDYAPIDMDEILGR